MCVKIRYFLSFDQFSGYLNVRYLPTVHLCLNWFSLYLPLYLSLTQLLSILRRIWLFNISNHKLSTHCPSLSVLNWFTFLWLLSLSLSLSLLLPLSISQWFFLILGTSIMGQFRQNGLASKSQLRLLNPKLIPLK